MALPQGTRLGPYEILALLGAGGMGEVYKARDLRLDRPVAIKVLPASLAGDREFRERFDREARTLSSLEHPHICALYDVGEQDDTAFLVMPLLEGETLADRLQRGPLPIADALTVAAQIADALDKAHRAGIVHRDLKPANVMLTKTGPRLLDFGLAKAAASAVSGMNVTGATLQGSLTAQGSILGTLQYMAPEQLEGQEADSCTDIFAFGTVLYEMLTGRKAFEAKSHASLVAAILEREPVPVSAIQPVTPPLDRVVRKCLAKKPGDRWQSAADLADELRWIATTAHGSAGAASQGRARAGSAAPWLVAALGTLAAVATLVLAKSGYLTPWLPAPAGILTTYALPDGLRFLASSNALGRFAVSPDGRRLVFQAQDVGGRTRLWVRRLDALEAQPVPGTDGAIDAFWSPDSRFVAFGAGGRLYSRDGRWIAYQSNESGRTEIYIMRADGSSGKVPVSTAGGSEPRWRRDGQELFYISNDSKLMAVALRWSGGSVAVETPHVLFDLHARVGGYVGYYGGSPYDAFPDGRHFLVNAASGSGGPPPLTIAVNWTALLTGR